MNDSKRSVEIKDRLHEWSVPILFGVPVLLALVTATIIPLPFLNQRGESTVIPLNFTICFFATGIAGLLQSGLEVPTRRRIARGIGDGIFGGFVYAITYPGLMSFFDMLGVSRWLAFG